MKHRRHVRTIPQTRIPGEPTAARQALETAWYPRMTHDPRLALLVTARGARAEPVHRWLTFKQAFSPELVRRFLDEDDRLFGPVLDPFAGSGTTVVECARRSLPAIGIDPSEALNFVTRAKFARELPDPPDLTWAGPQSTWDALAEHLTHPVHRAALMCAVFSRYTSRGQLHSGAPLIVDAFSNIIELMRDDLRCPLPLANTIELGDGRDLHTIADNSIASIITSPPYLSRHDYRKLHDPLDVVYRHWYTTTDAPAPSTSPSAPRLPAHPGADARTAGLLRPDVGSLPGTPQAPCSPTKRNHPRTTATRESPAVEEICAVLQNIDQRRLARVVRTHFDGLFAALRECRRVLLPGAPCRLVIGGARWKDVYIPTDSILADFAVAIGLSVDRFDVARRLITAGRKFGRLTNVAPRESVLSLTKR